MYQLVIEFFLGLKRRGNTLQFEPCIPRDWGSVQILYKYAETVFQITLVNAPDEKEMKIIVDGADQHNKTVYLVNDKETHQVEVRLATKDAVEQNRTLTTMTTER